MSKKVAIYARVSTEDQRENFSLNGQIIDCRKYAEEKGYTVVAEFQEVFSGASLYRPELDKLRLMIDNLEGVVVYELDRLSRNAVHLVIIEDEFRKKNVLIEYVMNNFQETPEGQLMKTIQAGVKEYEREVTKGRTMLGKVRSVKSGRVVLSNNVNYGYSYQNGKLEIKKDEAEIIRQIFNWYVHDKIGTQEISNRLTEMRIPTRGDVKNNGKTKKGFGVWDKSTVLLMIKNQVYAGVWHYTHNKVERISVSVPAIITQELWDAAQKQLRINFSRSKRNTKREYLLRSRIVCSHCGYNFVIHTGKNNYYRCAGTRASVAHDNKTKSCHRYVRQDKLEALVWNKIESILSDPHSVMEALRYRQIEEERKLGNLSEYLQSILSQLEKLNTKRERVLDLFLEGDITSKDLLREKLQEIELQIEKFEKEKAELNSRDSNTITDKQIDDIADFCEKISKGIKYFGDAQKRSIVEALDVRVIYTHGETPEQDTMTITGFFPIAVDMKACWHYNIKSH